LNELYRSFRVGDVLTRSNGRLEPERARGVEAALTLARSRATIRGVAFMARVDGTIYSRTLPDAPSEGVSILRERSNGDGASHGLELEAEFEPVAGAVVWAAGTLLDSTFTSGELEGHRLPQVPRLHAAAGARMIRGRWALSLDVRHASTQFDDDQNVFRLGRASTASAMISAHLKYAQVFASIENAFDADIDAGRTPLRTTGAPRSWTFGLRLFTR
jgi:outer membrane receptor protein involved in Fe transport